MKRGFTLIELVMVLGVMTVVTTGIFIATRASHNRALYDALVVLQADLRYIQRRSMTEGRAHEIVFDRGNNRYVIGIDGVRGEAGRIRTVYLPNGVAFNYVNAVRVVYTARGTASPGFTVEVTNGRYRQRLTGQVGTGSINIDPEPRPQ